MQPAIYLTLLLGLGFDLATAHPANIHGRHSHGRDIESRSDLKPAAKLTRRQVPHEHAHEKFNIIVNEFLKKNNPDGIQDAVFGLLGNAAASEGQGKITDTDCLQQATADRAFTNAKAENDLDGQVAALIYRALERNTGAVGQASVLCTSIKAVNPEIAAISQHQDAASPNAAAINKAIALELAVQIFNIGGDPLDALDSGTFAAGQIGDPTARGNSCDTLDDPIGCIFTQNLIVEDATEAEVLAFVAASGSAPNGAVQTLVPTECTVPPTQSTVTVTASAVPAATKVVSTKTQAMGNHQPTKTAQATATAVAGGNGGSGAGSSNLDLGSCSNPTIIFADGLDGRKEKSFEPADKTTFTHGSALNIKVITDFICQQLDVKCKAPQGTITACNQGAAAAQGATGQAAADAFNAALGF